MNNDEKKEGRKGRGTVVRCAQCDTGTVRIARRWTDKVRHFLSGGTAACRRYECPACGAERLLSRKEMQAAQEGRDGSSEA